MHPSLRLCFSIGIAPLVARYPIAVARLAIAGYGLSMPKATHAALQGRLLTRRVELSMDRLRMRVRKPVWIGVAAGLLLLVAGAAHAQSAAPLPISVAAAPTVVLVDRPVTLSGTSIGVTPSSAVVLKIRAPAAAGKVGATAVLNAPVELSGGYRAVFTGTLAPGIYQVHATAPDGLGIADTTFRVVDAMAASTDAEILTRVGPAAEQLLVSIQTKVEALPPSPAKDQLLQKMAAVRRRMLTFIRDAPRVSAELRLALDVSSGSQLPEKLKAERDALVSAFATSQQWITRSAGEEQKLRQQQVNCDNLEVVIEGFKFTAFLLNLAANGPADIGKNFLGDLISYGTGKGADAAGASSPGSFEASTLSKNLATALPELRHGKSAAWLEVSNGLAGTLSDLSAFAASEVMTSYCEQFTGPVTAHMKAQFFEQGRQWWEYEFDLRGRLTVHYPKNAVGSSVPLKGRLEGYAHGFKVSENAMSVLFPGLMSSAVQKHLVIPPPELGAAGAAIGTEYLEGSVAGAAVLNAFFFEVTGTAQRDTLILNVGAVRTDIDAKARVVVLSLSPLSLSIALNTYELPYKPAHFIFERTSVNYTIGLHTEGKTVRGKQHFDNEVRRGDNVGRYSVDIEACNPSC